MNKEARLLCMLLMGGVIAGLAGCSHKPAYSEMDPSKSSGNQNQNQNQSAEGQATASTPAEPQPPATDAAQPAPAPPPPEGAFKNPSFLDQANGGIKDLPSYPNAYRVSAQIGPMQGVNTMSLGFTTTDPMDKISAFYERVIKDNKWTVVDKIIDPEFCEWTLKKGADNDGKVQVKKDVQTGALNIIMVRTEKMEAPSK